jgi:hypothetical protein
MLLPLFFLASCRSPKCSLDLGNWRRRNEVKRNPAPDARPMIEQRPPEAREKDIRMIASGNGFSTFVAKWGRA